MVRKAKVRISWNRKAPLKMAGISHGTVTAMTGNTNFTTPDVGLAAMNTAALRVENAWGPRKNGALGRDELNTSTIALDAFMHTQAEYVTKIANGNVTIIHSAGFESTQNPVGKLALPAEPGGPVLTPLSGGGMKVKIVGIPRTRIYCFILIVGDNFTVSANNGQLQIPADVESYIVYGTKRSAVFTGLPAKKTVKVAAMVANAAGISGLSSITTASTLQ